MASVLSCGCGAMVVGETVANSKMLRAGDLDPCRGNIYYNPIYNMEWSICRKGLPFYNGYFKVSVCYKTQMESMTIDIIVVFCDVFSLHLHIYMYIHVSTCSEHA